jgi:transcriptional regulator of acetoin/glycerol metabolism
VQKQRHYQAVDNREWELAQLWEAVIRPLAEGVHVTHGEVDAAARQLGVSRNTVQIVISIQ